MHQTSTEINKAIDGDVVVIGGGWSGLMACKHLLANGLKPVVLEKRSEVGGVWRYSDDPDITTVARKTRTTSSRGITEISDYPMPDDYPNFPSHQQVIRYLDDYVAEFSLAEHIHCGIEVASVEKQDDTWLVTDTENNTWRSRFLIVSSGLHNQPNLDAKTTLFKDFEGEIIHSGSFKQAGEAQRDKRVLVFGGGETASDVAYEVGEVADETYYSVRNGIWFLRRSFGVENESDVLDSLSSPLRTIMSPTSKGAVFPLMLLNGLFGNQGHGQAAWNSPAKYYGQFFNKSDDVLRSVEQGKVHPRPGVVNCSGKTVEFADGSSAEVDQIILCTGYRRNFKFMPEYDTAIYRHYLFVFNNDDPTMALVGFCRPVVTSIPFMTEQQIRMVVNVFAGKLQLPVKPVRDSEIEQDHAWARKRYEDSSGRIDGLVDPQWYSSRISRAAGTFPDFYRLFLRHPMLCLKVMRLPAHGSLFMLNEHVQDRRKLEQIASWIGRYSPKPNQLRFYLDTCFGWVAVRVFEGFFRLWARITGRRQRYW